MEKGGLDVQGESELGYTGDYCLWRRGVGGTEGERERGITVQGEKGRRGK